LGNRRQQREEGVSLRQSACPTSSSDQPPQSELGCPAALPILLPAHEEKLVAAPNGLEAHFQEFTAVSSWVSQPGCTTVFMDLI